ncbi:MAG TPA: hypothetical protein PLM24_07235, partial [Methanothrix sp.]|nr:hypothetical protein [Methanothrix sp.]HPR66912.1 hypothetical protein [Methanothrix sp.]
EPGAYVSDWSRTAVRSPPPWVYLKLYFNNSICPRRPLPPPFDGAPPGICSLRAGGWRRRHIGWKLASSAPGSMADRLIDIDALVHGLRGPPEEEIAIVEEAAAG